MPFECSGGVRYFVFKSLKNHRLVHAIFTRQGGVSPEPWRSLNLGGTVGDDPERVLKNRQLAFNAIGCDPKTIYDVWQIHSSKVVLVDSPRTLGTPHIQADAMVTSKSDVTLLMRFADCVPILLFDPKADVVGLVHSGWKGTVKKVVSKTINTMKQRYGCRPENIIAGIGPSISVDHYTIGSEVEEFVRSSFGKVSDELLCKENGTVKFDLWEANRTLLIQSGVKEIEIARICTASYPDDWYSHRGEMGMTGRFGAVIGLRESKFDFQR